MAARGFCEKYVRLPLTTMDPDKEKVMLSYMKEQNLI
jgi:hypothetical protein